MAKKFSIGKIMRQIILLLLCAGMLTQCASYDFSKRVTQQGNLLPYSKVERLKHGMSKQEVAILMGTSLLSPMFNNNRWDYAYTWKKGNGPLEVRNVILYFSQDKLKNIEYTS